MEFIEYLFGERDKLNLICDSVNMLNPKEIDEQHDLYSYYKEYKRKKRLGLLENKNGDVN